MLPNPTQTQPVHTRLAKLAGIFLIIAVPLAYAHDGHDVVRYIKLFVAQIGTLFLTVAWFIGSIRNPTSNRYYPLDLPILLFFLLHLISWATMAINPFKSGIEVVKLSTFVILYLAVSRTFRTSFIKPWIYAITLTTAVVSVIGIAQYFGIGFLWIRSTGHPSATFVYRNFAAMYLIMAIPIATLPFLWSHKGPSQWLWGLCAILPILLLIGTRTRGAWVGLLGAGIISPLLFFVKKNLPTVSIQFDRRKQMIALICFFCLVGILSISSTPLMTAPSQKLSSFKNDIDTTVQSIVELKDKGRFDMWINTLYMIRDHWLTGVGFGNWNLIYPAYDKGDLLTPETRLQRPHNDFLWIASEMGITGIALYLFILFTLFKSCLKILPQQKPGVALFCICIGISLVAITIHAFFSFPQERIPPQTFWAIFIAIISSLAARPAPNTRINRVATPIAIVITLCCLYGTLQALKTDHAYYRVLQYRKHNQWANLISAADQSIETGLLTHWVLFWKAHALHKQGKVEQALETYRQCLQIHPNSIITTWKVGMLERAINNLEAAQTALEKACQLAPKNSGFHQDLGATYHLRGNLDAALQSYLTSQTLNKNDAQVYLNIGAIYREQNQIDQAINAYSNFLSLSADSSRVAYVENLIATMRHHQLSD